MVKSKDDGKMSILEKGKMLKAQYEMAQQKAESLDLKAQQSQEVDYQEQHLHPEVPVLKTSEKGKSSKTTSEGKDE